MRLLADFRLHKNGLYDLTDEDAFFDFFYDVESRTKWLELYNEFTRAFNAVLPRKEALDYFSDWKSMTEINALAMKHLRDKRFSMKGIPPKLRAIANEYLVSKGIEEQVKPISIMSEKFVESVNKRKTDKTKAAETEHAIRNYIEINIDEDPELFASFAKSIEEILKDFKGNWKKIYEELEKLRQRIQQRERENTYGLDRKRQMPFFRLFKSELFGDTELSEDQIAQTVELTIHVTDKLQTELILLGFWNSISAQNRLKSELQSILLSPEFCGLPNMITRYKSIISRVMEVARVNHAKIIAK